MCQAVIPFFTATAHSTVCLHAALSLHSSTCEVVSHGGLISVSLEMSDFEYLCAPIARGHLFFAQMATNVFCLMVTRLRTSRRQLVYSTDSGIADRGTVMTATLRGSTRQDTGSPTLPSFYVKILKFHFHHILSGIFQSHFVTLAITGRFG